MFSYGQRVKLKDGFMKGFYSDLPGTIVGFIKDGEKYRVQFSLKYKEGAEIVKIVPVEFIVGIGKE